MNHAPSHILLSWLWDAGILEVPPPGAEPWTQWIGYRNVMPDAVDQCVALYDTEGNKDGRLIASGFTIIHPTLQFRVRSVDYDAGWHKANDIAIALDAILNEIVYLDSSDEDTYRIRAVSRVGGIMHNGLEPAVAGSSKRRHIFTFNCQVTIN